MSGCTILQSLCGLWYFNLHRDYHELTVCSQLYSSDGLINYGTPTDEFVMVENLKCLLKIKYDLITFYTD